MPARASRCSAPCTRARACRARLTRTLHACVAAHACDQRRTCSLHWRTPPLLLRALWQTRDDERDDDEREDEDEREVGQRDERVSACEPQEPRAQQPSRSVTSTVGSASYGRKSFAAAARDATSGSSSMLAAQRAGGGAAAVVAAVAAAVAVAPSRGARALQAPTPSREVSTSSSPTPPSGVHVRYADPPLRCPRPLRRPPLKSPNHRSTVRWLGDRNLGQDLGKSPNYRAIAR